MLECEVHHNAGSTGMLVKLFTALCACPPVQTSLLQTPWSGSEVLVLGAAFSAVGVTHDAENVNVGV